MLVPRLTEVVRIISSTLEEVIAPLVTGGREVSAMATTIHMLRYVEKGLELEGQLLFDEAAYLRKMLPDLAQSLASNGQHPIAAEISGGVPAARDPAVYPHANLLREEVHQLRGLVDTALQAILKIEASGSSNAVTEAHQMVRAYLDWQIGQESRLVDAAFIGYGPRR